MDNPETSEKGDEIHVNKRPIAELDGYDLIQEDQLELGDGFNCVKKVQGTNTTASYEINYNGEASGTLDLGFNLRRKQVYFDIKILKQGNNLGIGALQRLASQLNGRNFQLITGGIMPSSRPYWEHLAGKGQVVPINKDNPETQYKVLPSIKKT